MSARSFYCQIALHLGLAATVEASALQDIEVVQTQLEQYLIESLASPTQETLTVVANPIDSRLKLKQCDRPLTFRAQGNPRSASNVTVKVQCLGVVRWSLYATARIQRLVDIIVANRALNRGEQLTSSDLRTEQRDINRVGRGFVTSSLEIIGQQLRRPLRAGDPLRASGLEAPQLIAKGDQLVVEAQSGSLKVVVAGTALSNGKLGQQIRVQNSRSERVFKAKVVAAGRVQVTL